MILPKGKPLYTNLKTKIVRFENLLDELKEEGFTGYIQIELSDETGTLFMERGKILSTSTQASVDNPLAHLIKKSISDPNGLINVYALEPELVNILASVFDKKPFIKGFPFDVVDVEKLLDRLSRDSFTGVLLVEDPKKEATFMMFFFQGDPFDYMYEDLEITLSGDAALEKIYELNTSESAKLSLISSELEAVMAEESVVDAPTNVKEEVEKFFDAILPEIMAEVSVTDLKKKALELAEDFPFLDPFDPAVYVEGNKLVIEDEIPPKELVEGLAEWLRRVAENISEQRRKVALVNAIDKVSSKELVEPLFKAIQ
ncbi:hypothetical protein TST_1351 [Thermosulfidibacter takaii ABI70S6]|uniref:DUF4388 domain-containing protein n=1 Tax=Thermosulfidibacter takaii (strain DSM 17441 / JCM 13301 / NBRC 103674 / ABI70S6) TaxID=1298851 RepID=A0A0S3QV06_THET7|nr:hypothetical protein [Thermosulfidibacter takaii]BAT72138.1 hypothetical protein TST_1351 [Thermosulfidibacter takaii ABI70S6]